MEFDVTIEDTCPLSEIWLTSKPWDMLYYTGMPKITQTIAATDSITEKINVIEACGEYYYTVVEDYSSFIYMETSTGEFTIQTNNVQHAGEYVVTL